MPLEGVASMIACCLADDQTLMRQGIRGAARARQRVRDRGEAEDGDQALKLILAA